MATEPIIIIGAPAPPIRAGESIASRAYAKVVDYWALTKPEINFLIAVATFTGFYLGLPKGYHNFPYSLLVHTLVGTLLVASGTATLNQYMERCFDAQMRRTARRPLAAGRIEPSNALWFGIALSASGAIYLAVAVNVLASVLAVLTLTSYLFVYTRLKRGTPLCTILGAFSGAMPPLIGWAAASGRLSFEAWTLYIVLYLWQFPHFMAIAWMYREDYDRAGYFVLPRGQARDGLVGLQTVLPLLALFPVTLLPARAGQPSVLCCTGALLLTLGFFCCGSHFIVHRSRTNARWLLMASIVYLPLLFVLLVSCG